MTIDTNDFRSSVLSLLSDPRFNEDAAQIQAKALLSELSEDLPLYEWTPLSRRTIRNVIMATFELENISRDSPHELDSELQMAARRLALIWESIAKLGQSISKETALLNAAINYEIAGYQANSMCIANRILSYNHNESKYNPLVNMSALFLQRRFLQLQKVSIKAQVEPSEINYFDNSFIEYMAHALSGNAFFDITQFFLNGDEAFLRNGIDTLKNAEKIFSSLGSVEESNLLYGMSSLLSIIEDRSTWSLLSDSIADNPKWIRYLKLLARGLGTDIYGSRSISELWPSQITALEGGLISDNSNKIIRMPTSAGKTRIAELAIVHTLLSNENAKCIYVAPYRALVSEVEQSFFYILSDLGFRVSSIIGAYESDDFENLLFHETDVLITTPEKLDLLFRARQDFLQNVHLFILDESHIVNDSGRGIKFEFLMTRLKKRLPNSRILVLSAMMSEETLRDFAKWFNADSEKDVVISKWRPSIQRYAKFEWRDENGILLYSPDEDIYLLNQLEPSIIKVNNYEYRNPSTSRINRKRFPDKTNKSQIAAELAYKFAELGPVLVFCSDPKNAEAVASALYRKLELLRLANKPISEHFSRSENAFSAQVAHEWLGSSPLESWLKSGIGIHYGSLPEFIRTSVEKDFRQKNIRVLIATNTLAQGVNLPIKTAIIHSCRRYINESSERIPARDYWNIAGRAGRAGEETEGLIIHININPNDDADYRYYLKRRENIETVEGALFQILRDLIQNRLSEENLEIKLDPEILALLVEESDSSSTDDLVCALNDSLVRIQADRVNYPMEQLNGAYKKIAEKILKNIPNAEYRAVYSSTGLSTSSCLSLNDHILNNKESIKKFLVNDNDEDIDETIDLILPACLALSEMQSPRQFGGNSIDLLKKWIQGIEMQELTSEFDDQIKSAGELSRFIEDLFEYRLPWGISSYIQIAIKVLDLDRESISPTAKFLPSMMKFGLPEPVACWAMSIGIHYRKVAIALSARFRREIPVHDYENFIHWLSTLSTERLIYDFGMKPPLLEDVSKVVFAASPNALIKKFTNIDSFLPTEVAVMGIKYNNRYVAASLAKSNQEVSLFRDYDNAVDRNAIGIRLFKKEIGYVPRDVAQILAPEMDTGIALNAYITKINNDQEIPKIWISIQ